MRLKGLQSLIEYRKIRSSGSLLIYLTEQESNKMSNKVFVHKNRRRDYTNPLWKKAETRKYYSIDDDCFKSTVLRSERKSSNWKTPCFLWRSLCCG